MEERRGTLSERLVIRISSSQNTNPIFFQTSGILLSSMSYAEILITHRWIKLVDENSFTPKCQFGHWVSEHVLSQHNASVGREQPDFRLD